MDNKLKEVGERIRTARKNLKLSQSELSEQLGISPSHMSDIENGKTNIGLDIFMRLTETLQVSADWLLLTDIPPVTTILNNEINDILTDCSPSETQLLLKIMKEIQSAFHEVKTITLTSTFH